MLNFIHSLFENPYFNILSIMISYGIMDNLIKGIFLLAVEVEKLKTFILIFFFLATNIILMFVQTLFHSNLHPADYLHTTLAVERSSG